MNEAHPGLEHLDEVFKSTFALVGQHVEEEVAKGRKLDDVLEAARSRGDGVWVNPKILQYFSESVRKQYGQHSSQ